MKTKSKVIRHPKAVPVTVPKWNEAYEKLTPHLYDEEIQIHTDPDNSPPGVQTWCEIPGVGSIKRASEKDHFDDTPFGQFVLSIQAGVVPQPILIAEKGDILDGYSTYAGYCLLDRADECPFTVITDYKGYGYAETFIRSKKMARMHLSRDNRNDLLGAEVNFNFRLAKGKARTAGILARLMAMSATTVANKMGDWVMEHITDPKEFPHEKLRGENGKLYDLPETVKSALAKVGIGGDTIEAEEGSEAYGEDDGWALYATNTEGTVTRTWFLNLHDAEAKAKKLCGKKRLTFVWEATEDCWVNTKNNSGWDFTIICEDEVNDEWVEGEKPTTKGGKKGSTKDELQEQLNRQMGNEDGWTLYATDKDDKMTQTWFQTLDEAKTGAKNMCHHTLKWKWEDDEDRWANTDKLEKIGGWGFTIYRGEDSAEEIVGRIPDLIEWLENLDIRKVPDDAFEKLVKLVVVVESIAPTVHALAKPMPEKSAA